MIIGALVVYEMQPKVVCGVAYGESVCSGGGRGGLDSHYRSFNRVQVKPTLGVCHYECANMPSYPIAPATAPSVPAPQYSTREKGGHSLIYENQLPPQPNPSPGSEAGDLPVTSGTLPPCVVTRRLPGGGRMTGLPSSRALIPTPPLHHQSFAFARDAACGMPHTWLPPVWMGGGSWSV